MTAPLISLSRIGQRLPSGRQLLVDLDLTIHSGDRIAIMGPSGSGKSTLLAIAGGLLQPSSGQVSYAEGVDHQDVSWVFQHTYVLAFRSVRENAALALFASGTAWRRAVQQVDSALDATGLAAIAAMPAGAISGGERQRLGVARALASGCRIVIADEPTANLDTPLVRSIAGALVTASPSTEAVIVATHDTRVADMCYRVLRLVEGVLVAA